MIQKYLVEVLDSGEVVASSTYFDGMPKTALRKGKLFITEKQCIPGDVYYDAGEFIPLGKQPSVHHKFSYSQKKWVDPRTLDDLKTIQWNLIKADRIKAENSGVLWQDLVFDSDPLSQAKIQREVQAAMLAKMVSNPYSVEWTLKNNKTVVLTADEMIDVGNHLVQHVRECHDKSKALRKRIDEATTTEQLENIVW